jgi:hypothetical protein
MQRLGGVELLGVLIREVGGEATPMGGVASEAEEGEFDAR